MSTSNPGATLTDGSSSTSTPTTTSSQSDSNTATLYLFTFLATILILVLLSASLVLRSYILRRRYRQRLQQALADGLFVDLDRTAFNGTGQFDSLGGFRRPARRLGPKPVLWDTWIHPEDKDDTWSSIMPVAVRCFPSLSPSTLISSTHPITPPYGSPSPQAQTRLSFFSQLRLLSPFTLSTSPSSPPPGQPHISVGSPSVASTRSPPAAPGFPDSSARTERDPATLAICVLVAMPDVSAPVHCPVSDTKGKGVDLLESQVHQQSDDVDPLLPSSPHRSGPRIPDSVVGEEELPLLEFGVIEMKTGEWVWRT